MNQHLETDKQIAVEHNRVDGYFERALGCSYEQFMHVRTVVHTADEHWRKLCDEMHSAIYKWEITKQPLFDEDGNFFVQDTSDKSSSDQDLIDKHLMVLANLLYEEKEEETLYFLDCEGKLK